MSDITETLAARGETHGSFVSNASISQDIKDRMRGAANWWRLSNVQRESLDLIATKISRILSGNADEPDHWHGIAGYADLAEGLLKKIVKEK